VIYLAFPKQHTTTKVIRVYRHDFAIPLPLPRQRQTFTGGKPCLHDADAGPSIRISLESHYGFIAARNLATKAPIAQLLLLLWNKTKAKKSEPEGSLFLLSLLRLI